MSLDRQKATLHLVGRGFHSISFRLVLALGIVIVLSSVATLLGIQLDLQNRLLSDTARELHQLSDILVASLKRQMLLKDGGIRTQSTIEDIAGTGLVSQVRLLSNDGKVAGSSVRGEMGTTFSTRDATCSVCHDVPSERRPAIVELPGDVMRCSTPVLNQEACHQCHGANGRTLGMLIVDRSLKDHRSLVRSLEWKTALAGLVSLMLLIGMIAWVTQVLVGSPVREVIRGVREIEGGNLQASIKVTRTDEIGALACSFNSMATSLDLRVAEIKRKNVELTALYTIVRRLSETMNLRDLKRVIVDAIASALDARTTILITYPEGADRIEVVQAETGYPIEVSAFEATASLKFPEDVPEDLFARWKDSEVAEPGMGIRKQVAWVPLVVRERRLGLLIVEKADRSWETDNFPILATLGESIGVVFENARLYTMAITDELTGLCSARFFQAEIEKQVAAHKSNGHPVSLIMADVDHFKDINDTYGHPTGDRALSSIGRAIRVAVRSMDFPCRYGGEEFAILLPGTDSAAATEVAERIRSAIASERIKLEGGGLAQMTASFGVASCPEHATEVAQLIISADTALYQAKNEGRNLVCLAAPPPNPAEQTQQTVDWMRIQQ